MTTDDDNVESAVPFAKPAAPPTQPGELLLPERESNWPTTLGVVAIVFGAMGCLGAIWGVVAAFLARAVSSRMPAEHMLQTHLVMPWMSWMLILSVLSAPVAVALLIAGIGLIKRRKWGITTVKVWAVVKMLLVVVSTVVGHLAVRAQFDAMPQQAGSTQQTLMIVNAVGVLSTVFGFLWGWALPVFTLIWLSRNRIKTKVAAWT
jgi:hypothetical protein